MPQRRYVDLKLYLSHPADENSFCQVAVLPTPEVGETTMPVQVPAALAPQTELIDILATKNISPAQLIALGKQLADCLLPSGAIRDLFTQIYRRTSSESGLRMRLVIADNSLKQLPWEYIYLNLLGGGDTERGFLLLDPRLSLVRHEPLPQPHPVIPASETQITDLRMLITAAQPVDTPSLRLQEEIDIVQNAIQGIKVQGVRITARTLPDATYPELLQALTGVNAAYIWHFAGHGEVETVTDPSDPTIEKQSGYILLLDDHTNRKTERLPADDLARMLHSAGVRLAVVGACQSGVRQSNYPWDSVAGALLGRDIPAVIAMQYAVVDHYAIEFNRMFYYALASGLSLDEAVALGRQAMVSGDEQDALGSIEWGVPVLYSRLPDGVIFPERIASVESAAEDLRKMVDQTLGQITATGKVSGISIDKMLSDNLELLNIDSSGGNQGQPETAGGEPQPIELDIVFEGGGMKGIAFIGALRALSEHSFKPGRLLGTSVGSLYATLMAAGYSPDKLTGLLIDPQTNQLILLEHFKPFMPFGDEDIKTSATRRFLRRVDTPLIPNWMEDNLDSQMAGLLLKTASLREIFQMIERTGTRDPRHFSDWLETILKAVITLPAGTAMCDLTLAQFHEISQRHLSVIAANISNPAMMILNHITAPDCPLVQAVRMSTAAPFFFPPVIWQEKWGTYRKRYLAGDIIVDGGVLSNFPIELFLSENPMVTDLVGLPGKNSRVLGLLLDETLEVPDAPPVTEKPFQRIMDDLPGIKLFTKLINTIIEAPHKRSIEDAKEAVARLPAMGYSPFEIELTPENITPLIKAGYNAMVTYLEMHPLVSGSTLPNENTRRHVDNAAIYIINVHGNILKQDRQGT